MHRWTVVTGKLNDILMGSYLDLVTLKMLLFVEQLLLVSGLIFGENPQSWNGELTTLDVIGSYHKTFREVQGMN